MASGFTMTVQVDARSAIQAVDSLHRNQVPFAIARSLTETAKKAQIAVQLITRNKFDLHSEFIPRGIRVKSARKAEAKLGFANAAVYTAPRISTFMPIHEMSGSRKARNRAIAVPGRALKQKQYRTNTGRVKKKWRPSVLLQDWSGAGRGSARTGRSGGGGRQRAFIIPDRGNSPAMIARRTGRGSRPLEVLYILIPVAEYKAVWDFENTVRTVAEKVFKTEFSIAMKQAIATAR